MGASLNYCAINIYPLTTFIQVLWVTSFTLVNICTLHFSISIFLSIHVISVCECCGKRCNKYDDYLSRVLQSGWMSHVSSGLHVMIGMYVGCLQLKNICKLIIWLSTLCLSLVVLPRREIGVGFVGIPLVNPHETITRPLGTPRGLKAYCIR